MGLFPAINVLREAECYATEVRANASGIGFDEPYSDLVRARITGIKPKDYTRMGVTIRHLSKLLNAVDARTKLLITLSDGKPDDYDDYRGDYGIEDTRKALVEAKRDWYPPFLHHHRQRGAGLFAAPVRTGELDLDR